MLHRMHLALGTTIYCAEDGVHEDVEVVGCRLHEVPLGAACFWKVWMDLKSNLLASLTIPILFFVIQVRQRVAPSCELEPA